MIPIGDFVGLCKSLSADEFCRQQPNPFLLHCTFTGPMVPTDLTRGITIDRLVLADDGEIRGSGIPTQEQAYSVFLLQPRNPRDKRTTIGCSSTCDVQINDESVSTLHAYCVRKGEDFFMVDNNSAAGTQINEETLEPEKPGELSSGDSLTLGYLDLTFLQPLEFYHFVKRFFDI